MAKRALAQKRAGVAASARCVQMRRCLRRVGAVMGLGASAGSDACVPGRVGQLVDEGRPSISLEDSAPALESFPSIGAAGSGYSEEAEFAQVWPSSATLGSIP